MATTADWIEGARLRTLPAAVAPVLVGSAAAAALGQFHWFRALLALGVALSLQVGVNYANDYSDGIRGTDTVRTGPPRLTGGKLARPQQVLVAALMSFGVGALLGLWLVFLSHTWWFLLLGAVALVAAWFYTGGKHPYGYYGMGEVMVIVFFGYVAVVGTTWTQAGQAPWWLWFAATGVGLLCANILMVNNIRDIPTDRVAGKRTVAVRLGDRFSRVVYVWVILAAVACGAVAVFGVDSQWGRMFFMLSLPLALIPILPVIRGAHGGQLVQALKQMSLYTLAFAVLLSSAFVL